VGLAAAFAGLRAWPTPLAYDGTLHVQLAAPLGSAGLPATDLEVALYDVRGRRVAVLFRGQPSIAAGLVSLEWKAGDRRGMSAGMYFLRAVAPSSGLRLERKLVLMP
jgi:hypothetical protein